MNASNPNGAFWGAPSERENPWLIFQIVLINAVLLPDTPFFSEAIQQKFVFVLIFHQSEASL